MDNNTEININQRGEEEEENTYYYLLYYNKSLRLFYMDECSH